MVVNFYFGGTVFARCLNGEDVSLVPLTIIDFTDLVLARVEEVFGVHDIFQLGTDCDVSRQVDD